MHVRKIKIRFKLMAKIKYINKLLTLILAIDFIVFYYDLLLVKTIKTLLFF